MRIRGISEETGEAIPKLDGLIKKVTGVDLLDDKNTFKSTYDIMVEISKVWKSINDVDQANLLEKMFGKLQGSVGASLLNNMVDGINATETAINSAGSAAREQARFMDSIQGRLNTFSETITKLWTHSIDSEWIKGIVDAGTAVINLVDKIGLVPTAIGAATLAFSIFSKTAFAGIMSKIAEVIVTKLVVSLHMATGAAATLGTVMATIAPFAIVTAVLALFAGIKYLAEATERQQETVRKLKEEYDSFSTSLEENESKQQNVINRLQELYNLRNANQITDVEKEELTRLENVNTELLRQIEYEKALKTVKGEALERETLELSNKDRVTSEVQYNVSPSGNVAFRSLTNEDKIQEDIGIVTDYTSKINELQSSFDNNKISAKEYGKQLAELETLRSKQVESLNELVVKLEEENKNYVGATKEGDKKKAANEAIIKSTKDYIISLNESENAVNNLKSATEPSTSTPTIFSSLTSDSEAFAKSIKDADTAFKSSIDNIQALNSAQSELSSNHKLSSKTLEALLLQYPQLLQYLGDEAKLSDELSKLAVSETENQQKLYEAKLDLSEEYFNLYIKGNAETWNKVKLAYGTDAENFNVAADAKKKTDDTLRKYLGDKWLEFYGSEEKALSAFITGQEDVQRWLSPDQKKSSQAVIDAAKNQLAAVKAMREPIELNFKNIDWSGLDTKDKKDSSTPSPISYQDVSSELLKTYNAEVEIDKTEAKRIEKAIKLAASQKNYNAEIAETNKLIANQQKTVEDLQTANLKITQAASEIRKGTKYDTTQWFDPNGQATSQYLSLIKSFEGKTSDAAKKQLADIEKIFSDLQKLKQGWFANIDAIDSMNDAILASRQSVEDLSKSQQEAIQKSNDEKLQLYEDTNSQIVDLLKKRYDQEETLRTRNHENILQAIDDEREAYQDYINDKIDALDRLNNTEDYSKSVSEQSKVITDLQKEIDKYSLAANSDDLESIAKVAELRKQKTEEESKLTDIRTKRDRDLRKENLQDNLKNYEDYLDKKKRAEEDSFDQYKRNLQDATADTALQLEAQRMLMQGTVLDAQNALITLFTQTNANATTTGKILQDQIISRLQQIRDIGTNINTTTNESSGNNPLGMNRSDFSKYLSNKKESESGTASADRLTQLRKENEELRKKYGIKGDAYSYKQLVGYYSEGGINTTTGLGMLHGTTSKPEYILNTTQMNNLVKNLALNPIMPRVNVPSFSGATNRGNTIQISSLITVEGNVTRDSVPLIKSAGMDIINKLKGKGVVISNA